MRWTSFVQENSALIVSRNLGNTKRTGSFGNNVSKRRKKGTILSICLARLKILTMDTDSIEIHSFSGFRSEKIEFLYQIYGFDWPLVNLYYTSVSNFWVLPKWISKLSIDFPPPTLYRVVLTENSVSAGCTKWWIYSPTYRLSSYQKKTFACRKTSKKNLDITLSTNLIAGTARSERNPTCRDASCYFN